MEFFEIFQDTVLLVSYILSYFLTFVFDIFEIVPEISYAALVLGAYLLVMFIRFLVAIPSMGGSKREKGSRRSKSSSSSNDEQ